MKKNELVVGHHVNGRLVVKSIVPPNSLDWIEWLETKEFVEFFEELLTQLSQISEEKKDATTLSTFLSEWRETALINTEPDILADIAEAEQELDADGGKKWSQIKKEIGL